jgi:hypothetical protein
VRALLDEAHQRALADLTEALDLLDAERSARRELDERLSQALTPAWQRRQVAARALGPLRPLVIAVRDRFRRHST